MTDSIWQILSHNGMEKRQQQKTKTEGVALNLVNLVIATWKTLERIVLVVNQMQLIGFRVSTEWASEVGKHGSRDLRRWTKSAAVNTAREMGESESLSVFPLCQLWGKLEKEMATRSSVLAWSIPGTGERDGLPSMGSHRVGHDWSDLAGAAAAESWK